MVISYNFFSLSGKNIKRIPTISFALNHSAIKLLDLLEFLRFDKKDVQFKS
jgi:hypothetical protein